MEYSSEIGLFLAGEVESAQREKEERERDELSLNVVDGLADFIHGCYCMRRNDWGR